MASVFGHAAVAYTIGKLSRLKVKPLPFFILLICCAIFPDADVIMFEFGYHYEHPLGHRGFTHSILFAILLAILIRLVCYKKYPFFSKTGVFLFLAFFLATLSHSILDGMTTGGRGVGYFIPFDNERYFLPWRFILVSPLGAARFFSEWGLEVLKNEALYIGLPCSIILIINYIFKKRF